MRKILLPLIPLLCLTVPANARTPDIATQGTTSPASTASAADTSTVKPDDRDFNWDNLMPAEYHPEQALKGLDIGELEDTDPRAAQAMEKLRSIWKEAPVVQALEGRKIRIGGFAVPLDGDGRITTEFLLVPYYGACIHVPPPPANQAILVKLDKPQEIIQQPFDPVWVEGVIRIERFSNDLADAGYTIRNANITPYEE